MNFRIESGERFLRLVHFLRADRLGAIEDLPLEVGEVDLVRIGDGQLAEAAGRQVERGRAAEPACADDQRVCRAQPLLPFDPDLGKKDVAAVAEELLVVQLAEPAGLFSATGGGGVFTTGSPLR